MAEKCEVSGCTADAVWVTMIRPVAVGPFWEEKRCDTHKEARPDDMVAQSRPLPPPPEE